MKDDTKEAIGTFIAKTIISALFLLAVGFIAKISYIIIMFAWRLI